MERPSYLWGMRRFESLTVFESRRELFHEWLGWPAAAAAHGGDRTQEAPYSTATSVRQSLLIAGGMALIAAVLRFMHLDAGLRHEPHEDERVFVSNVEWMIRREDWVPRYFEYPGLLFWILRIAFMLTNPDGPQAYMVARSAVAVFSCISVVGVTFLGCLWFSRAAGIMAGLLLAVSPVAVHTAHMVRPDSVVHTLILAALACAVPLSGKPRPALGWALGAAAVAIKFSAALVFPALLIGAALDRMPPLRIVRLSLIALVTFFVLSPWTLLAGLESATGMAQQIGYHYSHGSTVWLPSLGRVTLFTLPRALSWPGLGLAVVGLWVLARTPRGLTWIGFLLIWIGVFSSTSVSFIRFMVPVLGLLSLAAGAGFGELLGNARGLARAALGAWAVAALGLSTAMVRQDLVELGRPSTKDRALDWIEARPALVRVGVMPEGLGRFSHGTADIVDLRPSDVEDPLLLRNFDAVVIRARIPVPPGFVEAARFVSGSAPEGEDLVIATFQSRPRPRVAPLDRSVLLTSARDRETKLIDNALNTRWRSDTRPSFIEIALPSPQHLVRLELRYGRVMPARDQVSRILVDGRERRFVRIRGSIRRQRPDRELSEMLGFDAPSGSLVRVEFAGDPPFIVGELRLFSHPQ